MTTRPEQMEELYDTTLERVEQETLEGSKTCQI